VLPRHPFDVVITLVLLGVHSFHRAVCAVAPLVRPPTTK
jgi:hypothetical protein